MEAEGMLGDADVVSLAGACKELVDGGEGAKELLLKQIEISSKLHNSSKVIMLHHSDCGAYKASYAFNSFEEEKAKQSGDMEKAAAVIKDRFPRLEVVKVLAKMNDGEGKDVEFIRL